MEKKWLFSATLMVLLPMFMQAGTVTLVTGTPADDYSVPNTSVSPKLGGVLVNFDSLPTCYSFPPASPCTNYSGTSFSGVTISDSTDLNSAGLYAIPGSQSAPNMLYDSTTDGSADILLSLNSGTTAIGVGIIDSDDYDVVDDNENNTPVNITLQALGAGDTDLGSPFTITIPENTNNPGNGYYVVEDSTPGIYGLEIEAPVTDESGLAIDDVQVAPEPSTFLFLIGGAAAMGLARLRKRC